MAEDRSLEFEIEVPGTPEEVWQAIATGPGISSWYVPHTLEEREGGRGSARFGPGPEMEVPGRVAAWQPPRRIVFDGGEGVDGLAFEWLVEARDGGTCIVRLINTGFGSGDDWDMQYDGMSEGWLMFLHNLELHLTHFAGQAASTSVPSAMWRGSRDDVWQELTSGLGLPHRPAIGERVHVEAADVPDLAGTVDEATPWRLSLLVDEPAPGTAIISAESMGGLVCVSVWTYLYGPDGAAAAERDESRWQTWLDERAAPTA